jgi:hypothetical protein
VFYGDCVAGADEASAPTLLQLGPISAVPPCSHAETFAFHCLDTTYRLAKTNMEYVIGLTLAVAVALFASVVGLARERSFFATVLIVVGSYYGLFAAMGASSRTLLAEIIVAGIFLLFAVLGFKGNLWLLAVGLVGHGIFDSVHHYLIDNPGVPRWWPGFCLAFDAAFGVLLGLRLIRQPRLSDAKAQTPPSM